MYTHIAKSKKGIKETFRVWNWALLWRFWGKLPRLLSDRRIISCVEGFTSLDWRYIP
jgi:hypothetical protein